MSNAPDARDQMNCPPGERWGGGRDDASVDDDDAGPEFSLDLRRDVGSEQPAKEAVVMRGEKHEPGAPVARCGGDEFVG